MQEEQDQLFPPSFSEWHHWSALNLANVPAMLEPAGIDREDNKRADGMTNVLWYHGCHLVWDFTCPETLAPSYLCTTSAEAGSAVKRRVKKEKFANTHQSPPITPLSP